MHQTMSHQRFVAAPSESVFRATSLWYVEIPFLIGAFIALGAAVVIGLDAQLRDVLGVGPWVAWLIGGIALVVAAGVLWEWCSGLKWIAVSPGGIRWHREGRTHVRPWSDFVQVQRTETMVYTNGQHTSSIHGAEVRFRSGAPLLISPYFVPDYEGLIAEIENCSRCNVAMANSGNSWDER